MMKKVENINCTPGKCYEEEVPGAITAGNRPRPVYSKMLQFLSLHPLTKLSQKMETFSLLQKII